MFGKRRTPPTNPHQPLPPHPGPDHDGVKRVIPKEIWRGEHGKMLRDLGFSPDDEMNVMVDQSEAERRFEKRRNYQERLVAAINAMLPDNATVVPFASVPWSMWSDAHPATADFLIRTLDLYAVEPWNMLMLAADEHSQHLLGLPQHPRRPLQGHDQTCERLLLELSQKYRREAEPILAMGAGAGWDDIRRHGEMRDAARHSVMKLAGFLAYEMFGEQTCKLSEDLVRACIDKNAGQDTQHGTL